MLLPKLVTVLRAGYTRKQFVRDLSAGVVVGIVALPLAIAFAIASGVNPQAGLYTAIVAGFIISALGGSRVQIGGPTGAFVVIVYGIVQRYGVDGLTVATLMAGVILVALGLAKLGGAIKFIPYSVTIGFTSGIAVIIFSSQVKDLLGLQMGVVPADFVAKWDAIFSHMDAANVQAVAVSAITIAILLGWPKVSRRLPSPFVALIATTALVHFAGWHVETIGSRFGAIDASFPAPHLPHVSLATVQALVNPAIAIALLAAVESLLSAVVSDGMIGGRHRSNMELVAQGVANIASPLFGGIPATGAIARTATNVKNGGRTPVAGLIHALTLLLITLFFGRWAGLIPLATLAGILTIVAYHMSEWRTFRSELRAPRSDVAVLLVTFALTVLVDLTVAIEVGIVLAAFLFIRRMSEETNVVALSHGFRDDPRDLPLDLDAVEIPPGVAVYEIQGPFFFGASESFREALGQTAGRPKALVLWMREVPAIDSTGIQRLKETWKRAAREGTLFMLAELRSQPLAALRRAGLLEDIGEERVLGTLQEALDVARLITTGSYPARGTPSGGVASLDP